MIESKTLSPPSLAQPPRFTVAPGMAGQDVDGIAAPTLRRLGLDVLSFSAKHEESLVVDGRSELTPAQMVESRLLSRLKEASLPASHLQVRGLLRSRYES